MGSVQSSLGIYSASSFVLQVKNPHAPATGPWQVHTKGADYPAWIMRGVFGAAAGQGQHERRGREPYGLRFASCETPELLEYEGAQLLLIAAREGERGLEDSLGEGRGVGNLFHLATFSFRSHLASAYRAGGGGKSRNSQADLARAFRRRGTVSLRATKGRMDLNKWPSLGTGGLCVECKRVGKLEFWITFLIRALPLYIVRPRFGQLEIVMVQHPDKIA